MGMPAMNHQTPIPARARTLQSDSAQQPLQIALTTREKEALLWSAKGKSSWEISRIFNCTEAGVNYHFSNIRRKFGVSSRWAAVMMALELGLIQMH
jgi:LuxR family quorum-sensing transcriptional regulator LasR